MSEDLTMYDCALDYASNYGWKVFPVRKDKEPYTPHGYIDAKSDGRAIRNWWEKRWPDANIGIACDMSNLVVIDIDRDDNTGKDGFQSLRHWERENGKLPDTVTAITGRGGMHLYYYYEYTGTDKDPKNRTGVLDGVDIRANGYVVAPPSIHANGNLYEWEESPEDIEIAEANETVLKLCGFGSDDKGASRQPIVINNEIPSGKRNETLYKLGCSFLARGYTEDLILSFLTETNKHYCVPPLPDQEVERIVQSVATLPRNEFKTYYDSGIAHDPVLKRTSKGVVIQNIPNAAESIEFDRNLFGRIQYNELSNSIYVYGTLPWDIDFNNSKSKREWKNVDDSNLIAYLQDTYGIMNEKAIMHGLSIVANKNRYNPVKDFLQTCKSIYDGGSYVRKLLPKYLGVEDNAYSYEVMKTFMLGAVTRVYNPGCKFDYMPIIVGEQGSGKSMFLRFLSGSDVWFTDNFNTMDGDKASEKLRGMWILEVAELSAMKRTKDVETLKAFITSSYDNYRSPYSRRSEVRPRMCVFAGTTNDENFLTDTTGNRRFLPLVASRRRQQCMVLDAKDEARHDIFNAWGEIMTEYETITAAGKMPELVLSKAAQQHAEEMQSLFLEEDVRLPIITEWLEKHYEITRVCVPMLFCDVLGGDIKDLTRKTTNELHSIMKNVANWEAVGKRRCGDYGVIRCYERVKKAENVAEDAEMLPY